MFLTINFTSKNIFVLILKILPIQTIGVATVFTFFMVKFKHLNDGNMDNMSNNANAITNTDSNSNWRENRKEWRNKMDINMLKSRSF